jgi:ATP-dependent DNA helicase 2 subunit 1
VYLPPDSDKPQIAQGHTELVDEDTARSIEKTEIRRAFKFGGETVSFSLEEMAKIKDFGDPIIRIIGFKPLKLLPLWATVGKSTFIYPSEELYIGSTRVFAALHRKLLKDGKFGLAWYVPRRNATPRLAALIPGAEERDESGEQQMPPGLWVKPLPFADDIRANPEINLVKAPDGIVDAMYAIVQNLQLPKAVYDPSKYPNPALQWFFRILQALALEEDLPEQSEDKTLPRWRQISKRVGGYVVEYGQKLDQAFEAWLLETGNNLKPAASGASKRLATSTLAARSKKVKDEDGGDGWTDADMRGAYQKQALSKFKVDELKTWLKGKGLATTGKKQDLIDAVTSYFETKMEVD